MRNKFIATTTAALALGATLAFAQSDQSQSSQSTPSQGGQGSQSKQQQGEASKQELKVSTQEMQQQVSDINKASKLIGMQVRNTKNENLGKISDIVINQQSGKVAYVALSIGGVLGVGDKLVAVPFEALTPSRGQTGLVLDIEKQRLEQAPGFSQNNWPDLNAAAQGKTIGIASGASGSQSQQQSGQGASSTNSPQPTPSSPDQSGSDPEKKSESEPPPSSPNSTPQ